MLTLPALVLAALLPASPRFEDVTVAAGVPARPGIAPDSTFGSPAAWIDFDEDGWPDLVLGDGTGPTRLLRNPGGTLPFQDVTPARLATIESIRSVDHLLVAIDALDGATDPRGPRRQGLVFTTGGLRQEQLRVGYFEGGAFVEVPAARPAARLSLLTHGDLDGDGVQDIVVAVSSCGAGSSPVRTVFRLERGPVGYALSAEDPIRGPGCFPVPLVTDYFGTGRPALMVATDFGPLDAPSYVYQAGAFTALPSVYGMGIATSDINDDGVLDYAISSAGPDLLWRSAAGGRALEVVGRNTEWGESAYRFKWGSVYADFDNDGTVELWMTTGFGGPQSGLLPSETNSRDVLLDHGRDVAAEADVDAFTTKRAVAVADYDRDGRLDALVIGLEATYLYHNVTPNAGHWLELVMPDAPGALVRITACGRTQTRERSGGIDAIAHESLIHVGLGSCTEDAVVTVRWPWLGERAYGPFRVDTRTVIPDPGTVWVTPTHVTPGGTVTVRSTLAGATSANGQPLTLGTAELTAPTAPGVHRLSLVWNGAPIALAPKYTVTNTTAFVLTDPWPPRIGRAAEVIGSVPRGAMVALARGGTLSGTTLTASESDLALTVGGASVAVSALGAVGGTPTVDVERTETGVHVRVAVLDGLATPADGLWGVLVAAPASGEPVTLIEDAPPWFVGDLPAGATATIRSQTTTLAELSHLDEPPGPPDVGRSRIWATTPIVRADRQDLIEIALLLRDSAGQLIQPGVEMLPSAEGCTAVDTAFTRSAGYFGSTTWLARLRVGDTVGQLTVTAGPLQTTVWAVPADAADVDLATTLTRTESGFELVPRDVFGQRLGSGITTSPEFRYMGLGRYVLDSDRMALEVVVGGRVLVTYADERAQTAWTTEQSPSCFVGRQPGGPHGGQGLLGCIVALAIWRVAARRSRD